MSGAGAPGRHPGDDDVDRTFADIVSRWDSDVVVPGHELPQAPPEDAAEEPDPLEGARRILDTPVPSDTGWRVYTPPEDDEIPEYDFVEPDPAPLPRDDLALWGALAGLVGGPLLLLFLVVARPYGSKWPMLLAVLLTVVGFVLLVARSPHRRDPEEEDDGARV